MSDEEIKEAVESVMLYYKKQGRTFKKEYIESLIKYMRELDNAIKSKDSDNTKDYDDYINFRI